MKDLKGASEKETEDICRHGIINTLISYKKKFGPNYGELVIVADSHNYWREDIFPEYKAGRKKNREDSELDWKLIFKCLNNIRNEIKEVFPWRLLRVERCEAEDIIATLCKYLQENEYTSSGMFDEPQSILIVASDGDDTQLTGYENVRQWCPRKKTYLPKMSKKALKEFMNEHVVKGDTGDGIPNIFMRPTFFLDREEKERQKTVTQKILDSFLEHGPSAIDLLPMDKGEYDYDYKNRLDQIRRRYFQNRSLVLFEHIPEAIETSILNHYHNSKPTGSKDAVRKYFIKHRCKLLMEELPSI